MTTHKLDLTVSEVHVPGAARPERTMAQVQADMANAPAPPMHGVPDIGGAPKRKRFAKPKRKSRVKAAPKAEAPPPAPARKRMAVRRSKGLRVTVDHPQHGRFEIHQMRVGLFNSAVFADAAVKSLPDGVHRLYAVFPSAFEAPPADDEKKLVWAQIALPGHFEGHSAGPFTMDDQVFSQIIRNYREIDLCEVMFDFEHASEAEGSSVAKEGAPAQGWIKDLKIEDHKLFALVEWLEPARTYIRQKKYRFVSPAIRFGAKHPRTGAPIGARLTSVALTNQPFLRGLAPLQAKDTPMTTEAEEQSVEARASHEQRFAYSANEYMPKLRAAMRAHELTTPSELADHLDRLREHLAAAGGDVDATVGGIRLADYVHPLRAIACGDAMGQTVGDVLDIVEEMIAQAIEEHEERFHQAGGVAASDTTEEDTTMADKEIATLLGESQSKVTELSTTLSAKESALKEAGAQIAAKDALLVVKEGAVKELSDKLAAKDALITAKDTEIATKETAITELKAEIKKRDDALDEKLLKDAHDTYGDKKGLSIDSMRIILRGDRASFEKEFPVVEADKRHLQTNMTDGKDSAGGKNVTLRDGGGGKLPSTSVLARQLMSEAAAKGVTLSSMEAQNQAVLMRRDAGLRA